MVPYVKTPMVAKADQQATSVKKHGFVCLILA